MQSRVPRRHYSMKVKEIMTANPAVCTRETPLHEVAKMMVARAVPTLAASSPIGISWCARSPREKTR